MTKLFIAYFLSVSAFIGSKNVSPEWQLPQQTTPLIVKKRTTHTSTGGLSNQQMAKIINDAGADVNHGFITKDSMIWVAQDKYHDHRIFGYEKPDVKSRKMLLISIFTNDVEENPHHCPYGAYYSNTGDNVRLKYRGMIQNFARADVSKDGQSLGSVYILRKWLKFE